MSDNKIDHAAVAKRLMPSREGEALLPNRIALAQVHATLALVERQRIANLISYYNGENPIPEPASTEIRKALGL